MFKLIKEYTRGKILLILKNELLIHVGKKVEFTERKSFWKKRNMNLASVILKQILKEEEKVK